MEALRRVYENRETAVKLADNVASEENMQAYIILGSKNEVASAGELWKRTENEEKYITQALLEWEYMSIIDPEQRKWIKYGAELRQKLMEKCLHK